MPGMPLMGPMPTPMPSFASRIRASKAEEGFRAVLSSPRLSTVRCTVGELLLRESAALSSTSFAPIKSSTSWLPRGPPPEPERPLEPLTRASRMRASSAADGFRALLSSPRASTLRCTSGGQSRKSAAARSSTSFARMKSSISERLGSAMSTACELSTVYSPLPEETRADQQVPRGAASLPTHERSTATGTITGSTETPDCAA
mmetsp:Transcript_102960/g.321930  ORF Transcript_102960/g.321930 Transcript_102960/m.321930 type:complete len:203 (-) Transcript_102960:7-615(-)